jgi:hypothetical protein
MAIQPVVFHAHHFSPIPPDNTVKAMNLPPKTIAFNGKFTQQELFIDQFFS